MIFDDSAIIEPMLNGEVLPYVSQQVTTRRRIEGFRMGAPDMYWTVEGSAPPQFNTAGFITGFDTNIHPCMGWIEVGMDFEADSPSDFGALIRFQYGEKAAEELDNVIVSGDGVTQPLGIYNTVGATNVASVNGVGGPLTVADYENLYFAIPKQYRRRGATQFISTDTSYARSRSIQVGPADQRRVFGMDWDEYQIARKRNAINESITNSDIMACVMREYLLYRRAGFSVRVVTEDADLAKENKVLYVFRMRYGGQMRHALAVARMIDAQA